MKLRAIYLAEEYLKMLAEREGEQAHFRRMMCFAAQRAGECEKDAMQHGQDMLHIAGDFLEIGLSYLQWTHHDPTFHAIETEFMSTLAAWQDCLRETTESP